MFRAAFMRLQFGFVIFWRKDSGIKAAYKMLVQLTLGHTANIPSSQIGGQGFGSKSKVQ
jgi:hypothetical protein